MTTSLVCVALLGLLLFALGFAVSMTRGRTATNIGSSGNPADFLHKIVRAHGNASEYVAMLAVLILVVGMREPSTWASWSMIGATASRYVHAAGMILSPTLDKPQPLRFVGALGTYVFGLSLCVSLLRSL
jgi:uncharacterized membrane protein YecN with MAPEG domain